MRKLFNVKVNGVSYNVEVEEVLQPAKEVQIHNVKELIAADSEAKAMPAIAEEELVLAIAEAPAAEAELGFDEHYKTMYASNSLENTAVMEPVAPSPSIDAPPSTPELFDFDSPKFTHTMPVPVADLPADEEPKKVGKNSVLAPLDGKIIALPIEVGGTVRCGEILCVIDTDGVESEIMSPIDAEVVGIFVQTGNVVKTNDILFTLT